MNRAIKEKLDAIDELYPSERLDASKNRLKAIWNREKPLDRYPFTYDPFSFQYYNDVHTKEERLDKTLDEIIARAFLDDDFIPSIFPGMRLATLPSMFGAEEYVCGADYSVKKLFHSIEEVSTIKPPVLRQNTAAQDWLDMERYFLEETEGRIPIHVTDMQGPADVSGMLMGYENLMIAAYEDFDSYDRIMSYTTDAFIQYWNLQKELLGECFLGTHLDGWNYIPDNIGATVSVDSLAFASPSFFQSYYKPYLDRISDAFGGIVLHSCGDLTHIIKPTTTVRGFRGIAAGQMTMKKLVEAGLDGTTTACTFAHYDETEELFELVRDHHLHIDPNVMGVGPRVGPGFYPIDQWTESQKSETLYRHEQLKHAARV